MNVGAKLPRDRLPLHGGHHLAPDHQRPDIGASCLVDEFLDEDVLVQAVEGLDDRMSGGSRLRQDHADPLGA